MYFEMIWKGLRGPIKKALEALLMQRQTRREVKFPPFIEGLIEEGVLRGFHDGERKGFHDGERKGFHDGEQKGFHDGEQKGEVKMLRHDIFRVLQRRGLTLTAEQDARIRTCEDRALLDRWFDNVIDATSGDDVFR